MSRKKRKTLLVVAGACGFVGAALTLIAAWAMPFAFALAAIGGGLAALLGITAESANNQQSILADHTKLLNSLRVPMRLVGHKEYFQIYNQFSRALAQLSYHPDEILGEFARRRLYGMINEVRGLSEGKVTFNATESWRAIYEKVLCSPGLHSYKSVALINHDDYWRDVPGQRSLEVNFALANQGLPIERILILSDYYWPRKARLPDKQLFKWAQGQQAKGIAICICRESELASDPGLLTDFGIYGDRATGIQRADIDAKTIRFELMFDTKSIELAKDRWERLKVYATPLTELADQSD